MSVLSVTGDNLADEEVQKGMTPGLIVILSGVVLYHRRLGKAEVDAKWARKARAGWGVFDVAA
jgi:hypothetical protein